MRVPIELRSVFTGLEPDRQVGVLPTRLSECSSERENLIATPAQTQNCFFLLSARCLCRRSALLSGSGANNVVGYFLLRSIRTHAGFRTSTQGGLVA